MDRKLLLSCFILYFTLTHINVYGSKKDKSESIGSGIGTRIGKGRTIITPRVSSKDKAMSRTDSNEFKISSENKKHFGKLTEHHLRSRRSNVISQEELEPQSNISESSSEQLFAHHNNGKVSENMKLDESLSQIGYPVDALHEYYTRSNPINQYYALMQDNQYSQQKFGYDRNQNYFMESASKTPPSFFKNDEKLNIRRDLRGSSSSNVKITLNNMANSFTASIPSSSNKGSNFNLENESRILHSSNVATNLNRERRSRPQSSSREARNFNRERTSRPQSSSSEARNFNRERTSRPQSSSIEARNFNMGSDSNSGTRSSSLNEDYSEGELEFLENMFNFDNYDLDKNVRNIGEESETKRKY